VRGALEPPARLVLTTDVGVYVPESDVYHFTGDDPSQNVRVFYALGAEQASFVNDLIAEGGTTAVAVRAAQIIKITVLAGG
jgi:hypothetical protein